MSKRALVEFGFAVAVGSTGWAQVTQLVTVNSGGTQGSGTYPSISADGRYVAFHTNTDSLVPGDTGGFSDVFVRDRQSGTTERMSVDSGGTQGNHDSYTPSIAADGRYVAFTSQATNLVPGDTNLHTDIFVRDRQSGTTERVSVDSSGAEGNGGDSSYPSISADGRHVMFWSEATNLVPGDTNALGDVFVRDRQSGTTERVNVDSNGAQANGFSGNFGSNLISADGRCVAFFSAATNLVLGDTNGTTDVFLRDRQSGTTERISVDSGGVQGDMESVTPSISADGRYVVYHSDATNLVLGDTNLLTDIFVRDRQSGTTERASVDSSGSEATGGPSLDPSISPDGRYVAFEARATNLVPGDTNSVSDIFIRDRQLGTTERASVDSGGAEANGDSYRALISADGRFVAFASFAGNLVPTDTNGFYDVFVHDRLGGTNFTSLCVPGVGGVMACPCANPSGGFGQGCDNSAVTGGALLSASGATYLSSDNLVFTAIGAMPTEMSIVVQGNALVASGLVYGQGVRCVGGALVRLYVKAASGGIVSAPDFAAGDPTVSARSAARGDAILAGQSRWYFVYYRDPVVLGVCPASSLFNATQAGEVVWSP